MKKEYVHIIVNGLKCNENLTEERIDKTAKIVQERKTVFEKMINSSLKYDGFEV